MRWTDISWHCPTYVANQGLVGYVRPPQKSVGGSSYAYSWRGTAPLELHLGLGWRPNDAAREPGVAVPSEMYAVADSRPERIEPPVRERRGLVTGNSGNVKMQLFGLGFGRNSKETPPPHGQGYNILFCDGHVVLVLRCNYLYPPRTAHNWNRDNQPHPETWAPTNQWAVQQQSLKEEWGCRTSRSTEWRTRRAADQSGRCGGAAIGELIRSAVNHEE